jgi:hypothetical protein
MDASSRSVTTIRAQFRRYLKTHSGCLRCNRRRLWASARTRYLQWCLRCSRCSSRRCLMSWSAPLAAMRIPLRALRPRWPASVGAWLLPGGDGSGRAGRLGVPGDGRGSIVRIHHGRGSALARKRHGGGRGRRRHRAGTEASGQWSDTVRAGITGCGREPLRGQLARALGLQLAHHAEDAPAGAR